MTLDIGTLVGHIKLDTGPAGQAARQLQAEVRRSFELIGSDAGQLEGHVRRGAQQAVAEAGKGGKGSAAAFGAEFTKGFKQIKPESLAAEFGKGLANGMAGGLVGLLAVNKAVEYLRGTIDAASDLNETVNKSQAIFGAGSAAMEAWANTAWKSVGMSKQAALESSASFGDMFSKLGFAQTQAQDMSRTVVQLAADFGSLNNLGTADVLDRMAGGFRGEYDALQKLVPTISAATVEAEALTETGKRNAAQLTAQEKAAATLTLIVQGAGPALGDFAKTADSAANSSKQAGARAQDLATTIGQKLLPAWTAVVHFTRDQVIPALSHAIDVATDLGNTVGPVAAEVLDLAQSFTDLPGPLQGALVGMVAFLALRSRFESFGSSVRTHLVDTVKAAQSELDTLRLKAMYAGDAAAAAGGGFRGMASAIGTGAATGLRGAASGLLGVLGGPWGLAFTGATAVVGLWMQEQADARQFVQKLSESLDQQTGALTKNTRAVAAKQLQDKGIVDLANQMGISIDDVTDASLGQAAAQERVNAAIKDYVNNAPAGTYEANAAAANAVAGAVGGMADQTNEAIRKTKQLATVTGEAGAAANKAADQTSPYVQQLEAQKAKAEDAAKANDTLLRSIEDVADGLLGVRDAQRGYFQAIDDSSAALKTTREEFAKTYLEQHKITQATPAQAKAADAWATAQIKAGKALDIHTEAGRRNQATLDGVAKKTLDVVTQTFANRDANTALTTSVQTAVQQVADGRKAYVDMAIAMGMSRSEAEKQADKLALTRDNVSRLSQTVQTAKLDATGKMTVDTAEGDRRRDAFVAKLEAIDTMTASAQVTVDTAEAMARIQSLRTFIATVAGQTGIAAKYSAIDKATGQANGGIRFDGIRAMASGDITRQAMIFRSMAPILWNEAPGGEAYIPLTPAKRARSLAIWQRTGELLGVSEAGQTPASVPSIRHETNVNIKTAYLRDADDVLEMAARQQVLASYGPTP